MNRTQLAALVGGLAVVFVLSVAGGALLARQLNAQATPPAVASATPTPRPPTLTPTNAPPSSSPPTPATTAPATPSAAPAAPSPTPTPTTVATPTLDPPTVEAFTAELAAAITSGDAAYLLAHLHPAVIERYGQASCESYTSGVHAAVTWEVQSVSGPEPWEYAKDDRATTIADAWSVVATQSGDQNEDVELHFAPADGTWRWFTDCGDPL